MLSKSQIPEILLILGLIYIVIESLSTFDEVRSSYEEEKIIMYLFGAGAIVLSTSSSGEIAYARKTRGNRHGLEYAAVLLPCVMASRMIYVKSRGRDDRFERGSYWAATCVSTISSLHFLVETRGRKSVKRFVKQISLFVCIAYLCLHNIMREMSSKGNNLFDPIYVLVTICVMVSLLLFSSLRTKLLYVVWIVFSLQSHTHTSTGTKVQRSVRHTFCFKDFQYGLHPTCSVSIMTIR